MEALVCRKPGDLAVEDRPEPRPATGEVLIRIRCVGICGTDYHIYEGSHPYLQYPRIMGHELAAEVVEAPPGSRFAQGRPGRRQSLHRLRHLPCLPQGQSRTAA